jgi:hypothetical protein
MNDINTVYGKYNKVEMANPHGCYFIAVYPGNKVIKGNNLLNTGWAELPDGIKSLSYKLSTGQVISIPKFKAYLNLIEVSQTVETGQKIFHAINVKGLTYDDRSINYRIILKQDNISKNKIGDIIITKDDEVKKSPHWKMAA